MRRWRCFVDFLGVATAEDAGCDKGRCPGNFPQKVLDVGIEPHLAARQCVFALIAEVGPELLRLGGSRAASPGPRDLAPLPNVAAIVKMGR